MEERVPIDDLLHAPLAMLLNTAFGEPRYASGEMQVAGASCFFHQNSDRKELDVAGLLDVFIENPAVLSEYLGKSYTRMRACALEIKARLDESGAEESVTLDAGDAGYEAFSNDRVRLMESLLQLLTDIEHSGVPLTPNACAAKAVLEYELSESSAVPREYGPHRIDEEEVRAVRIFTST
jgi:hypothetical protein